MSGQLLLAGTLAAISAALLTGSLLNRRVQLAARVDPYSRRIRSQLGTVSPERAPAPRTVWGPIITTLADALANLDVAATSDQRLRQAGLTDLTPADARQQQLASTAAGFALGLLLALLLQFGSAGAILLAIACAGIGFIRWRATIDRRIRERSERLQAEAHTVAQLLAVYLQTGDTPLSALERLTSRTAGEIANDLARATNLIRAGSPADEVLEDTAHTSAEPAAARLYRLLASSWRTGGDPAALLALAEDLRATRRHQLARGMAKRRTAMVLPLVFILGPILLLFVLAPVPSILFDL